MSYSIYHGLSAFNRTDICEDNLLERVGFVETHTCSWSNVPIGPIGVFADIEHIDFIDGGSPCDCWSYIDYDSYRYTNQKSYREIGIDTLWTDFWMEIVNEVNEKAERPGDRYAEFFIKSSPDAVWVRTCFGKEIVNVAKAMASKLCLPLIYR